MSKEYRYRKHIYWGQYAILVLFVPLFLFLLGESLYLAVQTDIAFLAIMMGIVAVVFLVEGVSLWYLYFRLAGTSISINDDELIYKVRNSEKHFPMESVYLEFASIKYTGGWLKIRSGKDTIRLTVVLEDISSFLLELKAKLDKKQLSSHYDSHKLFGFLKTAVAADQNWERAHSLFGYMFLLIFDIGIAIFTGFVFGTIPSYGKYTVIVWAGFSMFWIFIVYSIAEIITMRRIAKKSNETAFTFPGRDLPYEKQVFDKALILGSVAYVIFSLFVIALVIFIKSLLYFGSF